MARKTTKGTSKKQAEPKATNGGEQPAAKVEANATLNVLAQYIKDFSFENPNSPNSLRPREKPPEIKINVNVGVNPLSETDYEVELRLEAKADAEQETMFNAELVYSGVFRLQGIPKEAVGPAVLIECPRILFPFARQIISDATRNGGFPPLMIDPIDFAQLYQARMAEAAANPAANPTSV